MIVCVSPNKISPTLDIQKPSVFMPYWERRLIFGTYIETESIFDIA